MENKIHQSNFNDRYDSSSDDSSRSVDAGSKCTTSDKDNTKQKDERYILTLYPTTFSRTLYVGYLRYPKPRSILLSMEHGWNVPMVYTFIQEIAEHEKQNRS